MFSSIGKPILYPVYASGEAYDLTLKHSSFFLYGGIEAHCVPLYLHTQAVNLLYVVSAFLGGPSVVRLTSLR